MRAGSLYHKVELQSQTATQDTYGQRQETWTTYATRRASIEPLNGREFFEGYAERAEISTRIRIRYDTVAAAIKADDRIKHGSVIYDIDSIINPKERNKELVIMCNRAD